MLSVGSPSLECHYAIETSSPMFATGCVFERFSGWSEEDRDHFYSSLSKMALEDSSLTQKMDGNLK